MNLKPIIAFLNIVTYYNKQQACKPGSVSHQWCDFHHLSKQPTPRQRTGHPKAPVYLALQPARQAAPDVTTRPGGLLPRLLTLIPHSGTVIFFPVTIPSQISSFQKRSTLCCPDFPFRFLPERWNGLLFCKININ